MGESLLTRSQLRRIHRELKTFEPYRKLNRILEVGAGRGWLLEQAASAGWETWAVEVNTQALKHLEGRNIHRILHQPAELFEAPPASMDVVRMWDVIEHLESPRQALERIRSCLRPGGLLRMSTTNFASASRWVNGPEWVYLNGSDHIHLFEPRTILLLLNAVGFSRIHVRTRSFNLRRKLYHPEQVLPPAAPLLRPLSGAGEPPTRQLL
jgi:2-polyprenyl-3-methyl-5-hydroxy-6-metoxy-1,4-benzoquinol methylase